MAGMWAMGLAALGGPEAPDGRLSLLAELGVEPPRWFAPWVERAL
ncbi:MAG: hypothetical protein N2652_06170 [Kiritimatiellae bacterium]|nr:hypothetical protein [Kiritimatiellia bacterium]